MQGLTVRSPPRSRIIIIDLRLRRDFALRKPGQDFRISLGINTREIVKNLIDSWKTSIETFCGVKLWYDLFR